MSDYRLEPATEDSLAISTAIVNQWEMDLDSQFEGLSEDELRMFIAGRADLVGRSLLLFAQGENAPQGFIGLLEDPARKKYWTQIAVIPGSGFMDVAVAEAIAHAKAINPTLNLQPNVNNLDHDQVKAWESRGFEKIQTSYAMKKSDLSTDYPSLPNGAVMRTLSSEEDWISMHAIQHDAFANHFGFVPRSLENFKDFRFDSESYDPQGIQILSINGEDVGYVESTDEIAHINKGYVHTIGVKHTHHKLGFGKILLQWAFAYAANKGFNGVELYVDIANKSGALQFYESAGMVPASAYSIYEKAGWSH